MSNEGAAGLVLRAAASRDYAPDYGGGGTPALYWEGNLHIPGESALVLASAAAEEDDGGRHPGQP